MLPLTAKTVLVTRAADQASQFTQLLTAQGATVVPLPALEIRAPSSWAALDAAIAELASFHWLILTSSNAVSYFRQRLGCQGLSLEQLPPLGVAVVGQKTAAALEAAGRTPDFIPPEFVADSLVEHFPAPLPGQRILFPRVESGGRDVLVKAMAAAGAEVVEVPAYESGCPEALAPEAQGVLARGEADVITFASSKTVTHTGQLLAQSFGPDWRRRLETVAVASIGPKTSDRCRQLLGRVDIEASPYTLDGLTEAIVAWASASLA